MPGNQAELTYYYPNYEAVGLTLVSNTPLVNSPLLLKGTFTDETVDIPYASKINISILALSDATVYYADDADGIMLPTGCSYDEPDIQWKYIGKISVEGTAEIIVRDAV